MEEKGSCELYKTQEIEDWTESGGEGEAKLYEQGRNQKQHTHTREKKNGGIDAIYLIDISLLSFYKRLLLECISYHHISCLHSPYNSSLFIYRYPSCCRSSSSPSYPRACACSAPSTSFNILTKLHTSTNLV